MAESSWKHHPVNLGFLAAIFVGIATVVGSFVGIQHWVDSRITVYLRSNPVAVTQGQTTREDLQADIERLESLVEQCLEQEENE